MKISDDQNTVSLGDFEAVLFRGEYKDIATKCLTCDLMITCEANFGDNIYPCESEERTDKRNVIFKSKIL